MSKAGRTRHSSSALLPPFHGASETERLLPRVDNVCPIRDPIQQRFTQSGIWKHRCPFREGQVCGHDDRRPLGPLRVKWPPLSRPFFDRNKLRIGGAELHTRGGRAPPPPPPPLLRRPPPSLRSA